MGGFVLKSVDEIYQELAEEFRSRSGLTAGGSGELAVRLYAVAAQIYSLYAEAARVEGDIFPHTALGEALDRHGELRGIARRGACRATGTVRFYAADGREREAVIPMGTVCMTAAGRRYRTTAGGMIGVNGSHIDLAVEAEEAGAGHNTPAGTILWMALPPEGVSSCTNPVGLVNGQDREGDESLRARVLNSFRRLSTGANAAFYEQAAMAVEGVAAARAVPLVRGIGTVDLYVSAAAGMPNAALLAAVREALEPLREIAVSLAVYEPEQRPVNLTLSVTPADGVSFAAASAAAESALRSHFHGGLLGSSVLQAGLTALVFALPEVANCAVVMEGGDMEGVPAGLPCIGTLTMVEV